MTQEQKDDLFLIISQLKGNGQIDLRACAILRDAIEEIAAATHAPQGLAGESAAPQTDAVDGNDFTLWVVVNRWEYVTERHEWVNDYIGELKGVSVKYKGLVEIFKQNK